MIKISSRIEPIIKPKNKIPTIETFNKKLGRLITTHSLDSYNPQWVKTEIKNSLGKTLGYEMYSLNSNSHKGCGATMEVEKEYRQRGLKIGEVLRLSSIIGIMENEISEFEIYSKPSAIYFHSKYKFEPAITEFQQRDDALESIIRNSKSGYEYYKNEAKKIQEKICFNTDNEMQRKLCADTSALVSEYIQKVLETGTETEYLNHTFNTGLRMVLKRDEIIKNKDFFNDLFLKHGINYKI